ncbi:MAG: hypothetical protein FJ104_05520 [Deltaproteobacteria bacterium]|nr:hypothetical protein [Deltaproteobacteria bacterium]
MPALPSITLPLPDPLALLDATALFVIQLLLAQHPELLAAPEQQSPSFLRPLGHAHLLLLAVRELQYAIEVYRACLPAQTPDDSPDDIFPF